MTCDGRGETEPEAGPAPGTASAARATTGSAVLAGGSWHTLSRLVPQLYALVQSVVAARFLGPDGMGRQSYIAFVQLAVTLLLTGGLPIALMRYVGEVLGRDEPGLMRGLLRWAWRINVVAAAIGAAVLVLAAILGADPTGAWVLAGVAASMGIMQAVPSAALIGAQRWREASIVGLVTGAAGTFGIVAVLWAGGGIVEMFAIEAIVSTANLVWTGLFARRVVTHLAPRPSPAGRLKWEVARYAGASSISVVLTLIVWRRSEFFFLERYSSDAEIALYSIAFSAVSALSYIPESIAAATSPAFATLHGGGAVDRIRTGFSRALRLLLFASLPLAALAIALGPEVIAVVYGPAYKPAGPVLIVLLTLFPVLAVANLANALLVGLRLLAVPLAAAAAAAVVNIFLDLVLIPRHGAIGGAFANVGAQAVAGVAMLVYACRRAGPVSWSPSTLLKQVVAATAAGIAARTAGGAVGGLAGVAVGGTAGIAAFLALGTWIRLLGADDARWLEESAGRGARGFLGVASRVLAERE